MRIDDLKAWLLGAGGLATAIAARSTTGVPLTAFDDASIVLRDWAEPTKEKILFLDPQDEEVEELTTTSDSIRWPVEAYVIVTRGATESVLRDQAEQYLAALEDCLAAHPDYAGVENREHYNGVEGKPDAKGSRARLIFEFEE